MLLLILSFLDIFDFEKLSKCANKWKLFSFDSKRAALLISNSTSSSKMTSFGQNRTSTILNKDKTYYKTMMTPSFVRSREPLVTVTYRLSMYSIYTFWIILSIPFGPKVDFSKSATAVAPTNESSRAFAPCIIIHSITRNIPCSLLCCFLEQMPIQ